MQELLIVLKAMEPGILVYMELGAFDEICNNTCRWILKIWSLDLEESSFSFLKVLNYE